MSVRLRESYKVEFNQVDFSGKMTLYSMSGLMQIIAANHATLLGFSYYKNSEMPKYFWILSRVKYVIEAYPEWEEFIEMETYPGGYDKLFAVRLFDIYNHQGKKIGYIIGDYVLMDAVKKRPISMKGQTGELSVLDFPYEGEKIKKLGGIEGQVIKEERRKAFYSEMDLNGHMNNAHYIRWIVDMLPMALLETHQIYSCEINYNTSIPCDTEVKVSLVQVDNKRYVVCGKSIDETVNYFVSEIQLQAIADTHELK